MTDGRVTLTYDIGPGSGLGHRRRMESLAAALAGRGVACTLVPIDELVPVPADAIVVDSYTVRADRLAEGNPGTVVAIDDLERDLDVRLLVDPNPGCDPARHAAADRLLAGPTYALVGPLPPGVVAAPPAPTVARVLVVFGAAGAEGYGAAAAGSIAHLLPDVEVRLVTGPWAAAAPSGVVGVHAPDGLFTELAGADLVITAGGVTLLEALALGRPTLAVATAANQHRSVGGAAAAGAAIGHLEAPGPDELAREVQGLAEDAESRRRLAAGASAYVDLEGPHRVAEAVHGLL